MTFKQVSKRQHDAAIKRNPVVGELRNWYQVGKMYAGNIYGSGTFPDGEFVYTAYTVCLEDKHDFFLLKTASGSQWILYKDKHHPDRKDVNLEPV